VRQERQGWPLDQAADARRPTCDISMNYGAFTNDSITTMYEVVRGALDADDTLKARGEEIRFRVRETAEWKKHAADLEMEMIKRGMIFEVINWSQGQAEPPS
jgi:hypothetical protein